MNNDSDPTVVDLAAFRKKKKQDELGLSDLRLAPSHLDDYGDRIKRIRESLMKINQLMNDLKKQKQSEELNIMSNAGNRPDTFDK